MIKKKNTFVVLIVTLFYSYNSSGCGEPPSRLTQEECKILKNGRDQNKSKKNFFYTEDEMKLIKKDQNPSWLCNQIENTKIEYISTLSMTENSEIYLGIVKKSEKILFYGVIKLVNFETGHTDKILDEINFGLMTEKEPVFTGVVNCFYDLREGKGERINLITQFFPFNLSELLITNRLGKLDLKGKISIFLRLCVAVKKLHVKKIIHRDLSLDNILINYDDDVKEFVPFLSDLGWTSYIDEVKKEEFGDINNNLYKPSSVFDKSEYGEEIDIYSMGVILYSLISNKLPREFIYSEDNYKTSKVFLNKMDLVRPKNISLTYRKDSSKLLPLIKWMMNGNLEIEAKKKELQKKKKNKNEYLKIDIVFWALKEYSETGNISGFEELLKPEEKKITKPPTKNEEKRMKKAYLIFLRQTIINSEPSHKIISEGEGLEKNSINDLLKKCIDETKNKGKCGNTKNPKQEGECLKMFEKCYKGEEEGELIEPDKIFKGEVTKEMEKSMMLRRRVREAIFGIVLKMDNTRLLI